MVSANRVEIKNEADAVAALVMSFEGKVDSVEMARFPKGLSRDGNGNDYYRIELNWPRGVYRVYTNSGILKESQEGKEEGNG